MDEICGNFQIEENQRNTNMNLLEDLDVCDREITGNEINSKLIPKVDEMSHLEKSG